MKVIWRTLKNLGIGLCEQQLTSVYVSLVLKIYEMP